MTRFLAALAIVVACSLSGCANPPPVTTSPISTAIGAIPGAGSALTTDITDAQYNFNQAVAIGALPASDPAPGCLNQAVAIMGIGATPANSFTPRIAGIVSGGSVVYIDAQQLKTLTGGLPNVPSNCLQLIGQIVVDVNQAAGKTVIGALPGVLGLPAIGLRPAPRALDNPSLGGR